MVTTPCNVFDDILNTTFDIELFVMVLSIYKL